MFNAKRLIEIAKRRIAAVVFGLQSFLIHPKFRLLSEIIIYFFKEDGWIVSSFLLSVSFVLHLNVGSFFLSLI